MFEVSSKLLSFDVCPNHHHRDGVWLICFKSIRRNSLLVQRMMKKWPNTRKLLHFTVHFVHTGCLYPPNFFLIPPSSLLILPSMFSLSLSTKLERDDTENFRQREERAARIAQEIETKDKKRFGIDDAGTEEELYDTCGLQLVLFIFSLSLSLSHRFSAVVRQEVAPPPPTETTSFRPSGGDPSTSSENVAPPPAAATVGVNSIPKTDASSAGSSASSSKSELLSDTQPVSGDSSTGLLDTPTLAAKEDSKSADSAVMDVTEVKEQDTTTGTGESASDKVGFCTVCHVIYSILTVSVC